MHTKVDQPINPRWVLSTLRSRGLPVAPLAALERALGALDTADKLKMREAVSRLTAGADAPEDMAWVAKWVKAVQEAPRPASPLAAPLGAAPEDRPQSTPAARRTQAAAIGDTPLFVLPSNPLDRSHHVYGTKAAFSVEVVEVVRRHEGDIGKDDFHSLQFDFAPAGPDSDGPTRHYLWSRKVSFRLSKRELPVFAAALKGSVGELRFSGHGEGRDKELTVVDQGGNLFFRLRQGRTTIGVPVTGPDAYYLQIRVLRALSLDAPGIDTGTLWAMVGHSGKIVAQAQAIEADRGQPAGGR